MRKVSLHFDTPSQLGTTCRLFMRVFPEYGVLPFSDAIITTARRCTLRPYKRLKNRDLIVRTRDGGEGKGKISSTPYGDPKGGQPVLKESREEG